MRFQNSIAAVFLSSLVQKIVLKAFLVLFMLNATVVYEILIGIPNAKLLDYRLGQKSYY